MSSFVEATQIVLTSDERAELEGLARSTKTEHRTRFKAQIVLMAAAGTATRAIARALGCTIGTASKWRARSARDRLAGLSEVGARGARAQVRRGDGPAAQIMGKLKLTVNEEKTRVCKVPEGEFDFLGYTFGRMYSARTGQARIGYRPSKKSIQRAVEKIHALTERSGTLASKGERGEPCGMPRRWSRASVVRVFRPRSSVSSTGQSSILAVLDRAPPNGYANWSGPLIARALGDVHVQYVWRFLRAHKIDLSGRKSWCVSNDPEFAAKAAEIAGLYMAPPDNAIVLAVDEKPSIQALERAQGYLKLPNGRAMTGQSHDYTRHGTTTLFAALDLASGEVVGRHYKRRRRIEFLNFMNGIIAAYPDQEIHVVLDNLSTHKPKRDMWLKRHKNVHFHYTPTHASWLNQIEIWFSTLAGQSLDGRSFTSVEQLIQHIDAFIANYNQTARPFIWTKSEVHQKRLKPCFTGQ